MTRRSEQIWRIKITIIIFSRKTRRCRAEQIKTLQSERLVKQIRHVWENVPYYRQKMEEKGVTPEDIHGIEDLHKLPFLTKRRSARCLSLRLVGRAAVRLRAHPVHQRHDRHGGSSRSIPSMISTCGMIAAPAPSSPPAAQRTTWCHVCYGYGLVHRRPGPQRRLA